LRSPFPGNGFSEPEKNAQKPPADCNDAVSENEPSHGSPPIRGLSYTFRKSPIARDCVVGPGAVTHTNFVNGLRVKQSQKAPLNVNGFLSRCQNWSDTFVGGVVADLVQGNAPMTDAHDLSEGFDPRVAESAKRVAAERKAAEEQAFADNWRNDRRRIRLNAPRSKRREGEPKPARTHCDASYLPSGRCWLTSDCGQQAATSMRASRCPTNCRRLAA
jgi:hypothetical protein